MTTFRACVIWSSLAISYALIINYSKTKYWKRWLSSKFPYFPQGFIFPLWEEGFSSQWGTVHCILFFLIFLFPSNLSIPYDCWWWCFLQEFRFDCFCQRLSDIILAYQRQEEEVGLVLFMEVCRTKALLKCVLSPDKKIWFQKISLCS